MTNSRQIGSISAWCDGKIANCRDLGGMTTRSNGSIPPGRFIRSSSFAFLPDDFLEELAQGVRPGRYVDLRSDHEVARDGGLERLLAHGWDWVRISIEDEPKGTAVPPARVRELYHHAARRILSLSPLRGPVVVACSLGKDRTGQVVALILAALGMSRDRIVRDYLQSNEELERGAAILPQRFRADAHGYTPVQASMLPWASIRDFSEADGNATFQRFLFSRGAAEGTEP